MSKIVSKLALAASIALALAFTFSCSSSSDDDDDVGSKPDLSDLSGKQVYLVEYNDGIRKTGEADASYDGNVFLSVEYKVSGEWTKDKIPAGKIKGGKLTLDSLPTIGSKYSSSFEKFSGRCEDEDADEDYSSCESDLSYPKDLSIYWDADLTVDIPGKDCDIRLFIVKSDKWSHASLRYFSKSGKISGTETFTWNYDGSTGSDKWDMNVSEGWNYWIETEEKNGESHTSTIPAGATLEWGLDCWDGYDDWDDWD